jgi:hypothetical protein
MFSVQGQGEPTPSISKLESRPPRQATLILVNNNVPCDELSFEQELTIGRHSSSDIQIQSKFISRHHAIVKRNENDQYVLHHLSSTNPSLVNGDSITAGERVLRDRDTLAFADKTFVFRAPPAPVPAPSPCVKLPSSSFAKHHPTLETIDEGTSCSMEDMSGKKSLDMPPPPPLSVQEIGDNQNKHSNSKSTSALPLSLKEAIERRRKSAGTVVAPVSSLSANTVSPLKIQSKEVEVKATTPAAVRRSLSKEEMIQVSRQRMASPLRLQIQSRLKQSTTESASGIEIKKFAPVKAAVAAESSPREKKRSLNTPLKNAIQRLRKSFGGHSLPQETSDVSAVTATVHISTAAVATDVAVTGESRTMSSALMKAIQARLKREEQLEQQQHSSPVTISASITAAAVTPRVSSQQQRLQVPRAPEEAAMAEKRHGLPPALREAILGRRRKSLSAKEAPPMATGRKSLRKSLVPHPASEFSMKNTPANKGAHEEVSEQTRPKALPTPIREGIQAARRLSLRQLVQVQATTPVAQPLASSKSTGKKSLRKLTAKKLRLGEEEEDVEEVHRSTTPLISAAMREDDGQLFAEDCLLAASVQISALAMVNELSDEHPLLSIGADDEAAAPEDGKSDDKGDCLPLFLDDAIVSILSPSHATRLSLNTDEQDDSDNEEEEEEAFEGVALYLPSSTVKQSPRMSLTSASKTPVTSGVSSATKMASSVSRRLSMSAADEEEDEDEAMDEVATQENDDDDEYDDDNDVDNEKFVEPASSSVRDRSQLLQSLEKKGRSRAQEENCEDAVIDWVSLLTEDDMHMLQSYVDQLLPSAAVILDGAGEVKSTDEESQELFALALDAYLRGMEFAHQLRHAPPMAAEMPTQRQQLQQKQNTQSSGETFSAPTNSMLMLPLTDLFKLPLDYIDASYADIDGDLVELYAQEIMAEAQVDESVAFGVALDAFLADPIEFRHRVGRLALPHLQPIHFLDEEEEGEEEEEYETQDEMVDVAEVDEEANVDAVEEEEKESVDVQPPEHLPTMGSVAVTPRHQRLSSEHIQLTSHKKGKQVHQEHARRISFLNNENSAVKAPAAHIDCQDETQQQQQLLEKLQSQLPVVASKFLLTSAAATPSSSASSTIAADQTLGMVAAQVPLPPSTVKKSGRKSLARRASQQLADVGTEESVELHDREEAEEPVSKKLRYSMAHEAASVPLPPSTVKQQPVSRRSSSRSRDLVASTPIANVALALEAAEVLLPLSTVKKSVKKNAAASVEQASPSQFLADEAAQVPLPPSTVKKSVKKGATAGVERTSPSQFLADEAAYVPLPPSTIKKSKQASHRQSLQTPNKRVGQEAAQVPLPPSTGRKASTPGAAAGAPEEMDVDGEEDDGDAHDDSEDLSHRASIVSNPPSETSTSMIDIPINFKHEDAEEDRVEEEEHQPSAPVPLATAPTETTMEDVEPEVEMIVAPVKKVKKSVASTATRGKKSTAKKDIPAEEEVSAAAVEIPERTVTVEEVPPSKPAPAPAPAVGRGRGRKTVEVVEEPEPVAVETSSSSSNVPESEKVSGKKRGRSTTVPGVVKEEPVAVVPVIRSAEQPEAAVVKPAVTKRGGRAAKNVTTM